jgi:uncharacterized protein
MLGGLSRWLRAAGYDAAWQAGIEDWDLIRLARREGRLLLSSDTGIFRTGIVRDGDLPAFFIPAGLNTGAQLALVMDKLGLQLREPRCMSCGGRLGEVAKEQIRHRVPPRSFEWQENFFQCLGCGRIFWRGTHWQRIAGKLQQAASAGRR